MKLVAGGVVLLVSAGAAHAGGLILPGSGAVSTSRAGAAVASVWGPDSLGINPAGLASAKGTVVSVSSAFINYDLSFQRAGTYDETVSDDMVTLPWEGLPYPHVEDQSSPPIGFAGFQAVPVVGVSSDLGGAVPGLTLALGVWAPNAYPTRDIRDPRYPDPYQIDDPNRPPPPSRYDTVTQEAAIILPTIAAAYRILPNLDVGARFAWGIADVKVRVFLWGQPQNFDELTYNESLFTFEGKDHFVPNYAFGVRYRPLPNLELGGIWSSELVVNAKGVGIPQPSPNLNVGGNQVTIVPVEDSVAQCAPGGVDGRLKACSNFALPMLVKIGARWIFRDGAGAERGDVEFNFDWENWSTERASTYEVIVDGAAAIGGVPSLNLEHTFLRHGFKDTYSFRLGGSYSFGAGPGTLITRGGISYDTKTAKDGWDRLDIDGAARTMFAAGVGYRTRKFQIDLGGGFVYEGHRTVGNDPPCDPIVLDAAQLPPFGGPSNCTLDGEALPVPERTGPDPAQPGSVDRNTNQNPFNEGRYYSHYILFALGFSTWF